jgi:2-hydroxy-4-carboxymuconate semialdehyde hemiacetal dehydrogenase
MRMRIAVIGYGIVGAIHAGKFAGEPAVEVATVFGPRREKAEAFASAHGIKQVSATLQEAISMADAVIVCSPSPLHYEQARECLRAGVPTLVELPPCETSGEAEDLAKAAREAGVQLQCAHTSRYLAAYARVFASLRASELGEIQEVTYTRHTLPRDKNWSDNALFHHAAHPVELLAHWFGNLTPRSAVVRPQVRTAQNVALLGQLANGAPFTITVTYASQLPHVRMLIVGDQHTVETDGFSYIRSDLGRLNLTYSEQETYENGIHDQDMEFLRACRGEAAGVDWQETLRLVRTIESFREFAGG